MARPIDAGVFLGYLPRNVVGQFVNREETKMDVLGTLFSNMGESTVPGMFGVGGILVYFVVIVGAALFRIKEIYQQEEHH